MVKRGFVFYSLFFILFFTTFSSAILINEFTVDPQTDWDGSGNATSSDEWVELYNEEQNPINFSGWSLALIDGSNATQNLTGTIQPGAYKIILNPIGTQNNDGQLLLYNSAGDLVDAVTFGSWDDGNTDDNAPNGNADSTSNECLARIPNGFDTNNDAANFQKTRCTFGAENGVLPPNEQELNVTIAGRIVFHVTPRGLEFGVVQPGSFNNPALNGPIVFNVTGSGADVNVEITQIIGFPFEEGLRIDGNLALGSFWAIPASSPIRTAVPTLDVPLDAPPGNNQGTIVYTISGTP